MCQIMHELAERGDVILVGRGGSQILKDDPQAFHVRLVAPLPVRVRRVMEYRWVQEGVAKKLIGTVTRSVPISTRGASAPTGPARWNTT